MILEVFCCSGGMAEGLRRAGLHVDMAFDADPEACDSYEANLGHRPVQIDVRDLLRMARAGWSAGDVELLVADPPCTPWSRAGKRLGTADERDMLEVTVALVRVLRPRAYLIANVPGLDDAPNWPVVQRTIGGLSREGYCVVDFARLDAADYGVPQHRVRPFWYGHLGGRCVEWPARTHAPSGSGPTLPGITQAPEPWVTCRQALGHLSPEDLGTPVRLRWRGNSDGGIVFDGPNHRPSRLDAPARTLTRNTHGDGALLVHERHPINRPDAPSYTMTTKGDVRGAQGSCCVEWPWDRPATTVHCGGRMAPPGHHEKSYLSDNRGHGPNAVKLSERAGAILQGFPETWVFAGKTKRSRWSMIGQAVPPPLAEAVGRSILRALRKERAA